MSLLNEYIGKRTSDSELETELSRLKEEKALITFLKLKMGNMPKQRKVLLLIRGKEQRELYNMTKNINMAFDNHLTCLALMNGRHV